MAGQRNPIAQQNRAPGGEARQRVIEHALVAAAKRAGAKLFPSDAFRRWLRKVMGGQRVENAGLERREHTRGDQ